MMSSAVRVVDSGLVYRNPKPYLRSVVAYHPSVVLLADRNLLATFDLGEAVESLDYHTVASRSADGGRTWQLESPLLSDPPARTTHTIRVRRLSDGSLVGLGAFFHREDPDEGLVNRETSGYVATDLFWIRSTDAGRSWSRPQPVVSPLPSTAWEFCHPLLELQNGRWLAPVATWRSWDGSNPPGEQTVALVSDNRGQSWPRFTRMFDGRSSGRSHLEVSATQMADGRILAVSWVFSFDSGETFPTEFTISEDRGETFSEPLLTGFLAQTCKILQLADGRILCAYRRHDQPGLWATVARLEGSRWTNLVTAPLWEGASSGMAGQVSSGQELSELKFGYPSLCQLPGGEVMLLFWCQEGCLTNIRWLRLQV
ncbi:MAG: sialidase family protein [Acidobacteriota bacterium]